MNYSKPWNIVWINGSHKSDSGGQMKSATRLLSSSLLILAIGISVQPRQSNAQGAKMTVGQTGTNPGTALYFIAQKEKLFAKHGLDVNIVKTNTTAAVQAMLGGSMQLSTGSGAAAFVTATLEGAPPFVLVSSWVNVFPSKVMAQKDITKVEDLKGKTGHVGAPFGTIPDTALRFALTKLKLDPERDVKLVQNGFAGTRDPVATERRMASAVLPQDQPRQRRAIHESDLRRHEGLF